MWVERLALVGKSGSRWFARRPTHHDGEAVAEDGAPGFCGFMMGLVWMTDLWECIWL